MEDGENSVIGKNAQFPVGAPNIVDIVNVTIRHQHMVGRIALRMAQLTLKLRDVMKIHVQVGRLIKKILRIGFITFIYSSDNVIVKCNLCFL